MGFSASGAANPYWSGDRVTYSGAHRRLGRARGRAAEHPCADCGLPARQWSYDEADPGEIRDAQGRRYSTNPDHYVPRCSACHAFHDGFGARNHGRTCTEAGCAKPAKSRTLCSAHYEYKRKRGAWAA